MKKILLIDVPNLFYRAFYSIPHTLTDNNGMPINAVFGTASAILSLFENEKPDYIFAFKDEREKTFRHEQDGNYKAQRPDMPVDLVSQLMQINDLFSAFSIPLISKVGFEADDCIATAAEKFKDANNQVFILSADHDLFGLIDENVFALKPEKGGKLTVMNSDKVKEKMGVYPKQIADLKAIAGDTSDNIPGIAGIGLKGAAEMLNEYDSLENLLNNSDQISGRRGKLLQENIELALETKKMTELHYNVPIDLEIEKGSIDNINWNTVKDFFQEKGFRMLLLRLDRMNINNNQGSKLNSSLFSNEEIVKDPEKNTQPEQLGLF